MFGRMFENMMKGREYNAVNNLSNSKEDEKLLKLIEEDTAEGKTLATQEMQAIREAEQNAAAPQPVVERATETVTPEGVSEVVTVKPTTETGQVINDPVRSAIKFTYEPNSTANNPLFKTQAEVDAYESGLKNKGTKQMEFSSQAELDAHNLGVEATRNHVGSVNTNPSFDLDMNVFEGLRDFGIAALSTGNPFIAAGAGLNKLFGESDAEIAAANRASKRGAEFDYYAKEGMADPRFRDIYTSTGDSRLFRDPNSEASYKTFGSDATGYYKINEQTGQTEMITKGFGDTTTRAMNKEAAKKASDLKTQGNNMYQAASNQLELLNSITDDDVYNAAGVSSIGGAWTPGTRSSVAKFNQLLASGFMQNISAMKGLGSLSNAEGSKVTAAYTSLVDPDNNQLKTGLDEGFVKREIAKLKESANRLQKIGKFYEMYGREPTIKELKTYGLSSDGVTVVKVQVNPRTGQRREVLSDGSTRII